MEKLVETALKSYTKKMEQADYGLLINSRAGGKHMLSIRIEFQLGSVDSDTETIAALTREILRQIRGRSGSQVESYAISVQLRTQCGCIPWLISRNYMYSLHMLIHCDTIPQYKAVKPV
jgi:hypothetical protein